MPRRLMAAGYACLALTLVLVARAHAVGGPEPLHRLVPAGASTAAGERPSVVLLLNARDCAERIEALAAWNAPHRSGQARVVGLVAVDGREEHTLATMRAGAGLVYPLVPVSRDRLVGVLDALNYASTPVAIHLDARGRVRTAAPLYEVDAPGAAADLLRRLAAAPGEERRPTPIPPTAR